MMEGIPLLAIMDECDIVSDIRAGAGMALKNGQSEALAQKIRFLRDHPEAVEAMRSCCRQLYLEKYTPEICLAKYQALFRKLLGTPE